VLQARVALVCSRLMEQAPRPNFQPAGAGAVLLSGTGLGIGAGALVGWAAGSIGYGILGGAVVGVPVGVYAVYRRYRGAFSP
jgi:F0F1-type ATP synthase assembly protein I